MSRDPRIPWSSDVSRAEWIRPRLHEFGHDIGAAVPDGFEAYCRIFHPIDEGHGEPAKSWAEVAATHGRIAHPGMQLHKINRPVGVEMPDGYVMDNGPDWGSCPLALRVALAGVLRDATTTPQQCWFCVWDGWGGLD